MLAESALKSIVAFIDRETGEGHCCKCVDTGEGEGKGKEY
jgi:hypothetical protein